MAYFYPKNQRRYKEVVQTIFVLPQLKMQFQCQERKRTHTSLIYSYNLTKTSERAKVLKTDCSFIGTMELKFYICIISQGCIIHLFNFTILCFYFIFNITILNIHCQITILLTPISVWSNVANSPMFLILCFFKL